MMITGSARIHKHGIFNNYLIYTSIIDVEVTLEELIMDECNFIELKPLT